MWGVIKLLEIIDIKNRVWYNNNVFKKLKKEKLRKTLPFFRFYKLRKNRERD